MIDLRCKKCQKLLLKYDNFVKLEVKCPRCGHTNVLHHILNYRQSETDKPVAAST